MPAFVAPSSRADFDQLRRARRHNAESLWLRMCPDASAQLPRVAFAIGVQYGKATHRNRLRRRLRAVLVELSLRPAGLRPGLYLIGPRTGHKNCVPISYARALRDLTELLDRSSATNGGPSGGPSGEASNA